MCVEMLSLLLLFVVLLVRNVLKSAEAFRENPYIQDIFDVA